MKTISISINSEYIEKKPENYTNKLQKIVVLNIRKHYESTYNKKTNKSSHRNFTYIYYKTKEGTLYPARNGGYLDGLVGCMKLTEFKAKYTNQ